MKREFGCKGTRSLTRNLVNDQPKGAGNLFSDPAVGHLDAKIE